MDDALKNSIWNVFKQIIIEQGKFTKHSSLPNIQDTPISTLNKLFKLNRRITTFFIHNDADRM
nr:hypothetical protein [Acinetobacter lwoffii]